ncbi:MAG: hypothetical protein WKF73_17150 [Nocardioidaceae bacterium]
MTGSGEGLSASGRLGLQLALELVRTEVRQAPLFALASRAAAAGGRRPA